jgi:branched-chain amino acid transport system substrate-binding protein
MYTDIVFRQSRRAFIRALRSVAVCALLPATFLALQTGLGESQTATTAPPIRLGAVLPLTGDSASWGQQGRWGIDFAVRQINARGGIQGRQIEIVFEDSQALPRLAVTAFSKLTQVDHVPAVIGDIVSATTLAMAPLAEERQVVLIAPTASAPALTKAGKFIFRVWPSDLLEGGAAANWARSQGMQKAAILHIANDYGSGLAGAFGARFESLGGKVVSIQSYGQDQTDFKPYLLRVKSEAPDVVYLVSYYKDAAQLLKQAKEIGVNRKFLGATAVESPDLLTLAGTAAEGLVYPTIVDFDPSNPTATQTRFISEFKAAYGKDPDWASSHAHDAALVILEVMKAGAITGEQIRAAIDKRRVFEGVTGPIHFDENGDVIDKQVVMKTVRGGAFVVLNSGG